MDDPLAIDDDEKGPLRRCLVTGESTDPIGMIRFVVGPEDTVVPDVSGRLPGRGMWIGARRDLLENAIAKRLFGRAARRTVVVDPGLSEQVRVLLTRQCLDLLGLARRAGAATAGFEKVEDMLRRNKAGVLIEAEDGAADGCEKLRRLAPATPVVALLPASAMAGALGRDGVVVHAAIAKGKFAERFVAASNRLAGFREAA